MERQDRKTGRKGGRKGGQRIKKGKKREGRKGKLKNQPLKLGCVC